MERRKLYLIMVGFFCLKPFQIEGKIDPGSEEPFNIVKRHLRWNANGYIVSSGGSTYKINYLQPHVQNVAVKSDGDYLAFTLYMKNGRVEASNTGIFHFIDSYIADEKRSNCRRPTRHAGAYYHFYGKCPEDETSVVASGYCYQGSNGRGLVYNSQTFNSASMTYVDKQYYLNDDRAVNPIEENLIKVCFNSWKSSGFQVNLWKCSTSNIPVASRLTSDSEKTSDHYSSVCSDCECTPVNGSSGINLLNMQSVFIGFLGVLIKMIY